ERYQGMARRAALRMVFNEDVAQDLTQQALFRAYLALEQLREDAHFRRWLYGIVLNVCRPYLRHQKFVQFPLEGLAEGHVAGLDRVVDPEQMVEEAGVGRRVLEAIHDLTAENKLTVLLFYYDQLSLQEVAESLGISVVAVKGRLHKVRQRLRKNLSM